MSRILVLGGTGFVGRTVCEHLVQRCASDAIVAMREGWVHANTAQMLYQMGYQGIRAAAAAARGEAVSPRIDTGFFLVTPSTAAVYSAMVGIE